MAIDRVRDSAGEVTQSVVTVRLFPFYLRNRLTIGLELLHEYVMTVARRGLKVKVKVMGQANAVGPTLIEGSFF